MTELEIIRKEYDNAGTSWTRNEQFDKNGYLLVKNLWNPKELYSPCGVERGRYTWWGRKIDQFNVTSEVEEQVEGSFARYYYPQYRQVHNGIRPILEKIIGRKLYNTYYYDRFYFPGQRLDKHTDRDACEISVTVHVSTNIEEQWPIWIKTPDVFKDDKKTELLTKGKNNGIILEPGDGVIYKGCERPHWREELPGLLDMSLNLYHKGETQQLYYHQIFFHYVLQDGIRAHCAWDRGAQL